MLELTSTDKEGVGHERFEHIDHLSSLLCLHFAQLKLNGLRKTKEDKESMDNRNESRPIPVIQYINTVQQCVRVQHSLCCNNIHIHVSTHEQRHHQAK